MNLLSLYYSICEKVKMLIPNQSSFLKRKVIVCISDIEFLIHCLKRNTYCHACLKSDSYYLIITTTIIFTNRNLKSILDRSPENINIKYAVFTVMVSVKALFVFMGSRIRIWEAPGFSYDFSLKKAFP